MEAEETVGFRDFSLATAFERLVASIETCVATWATRGVPEGETRLKAQLQHRLPWRADPYTLALHLPAAAPQPSPPSDQAPARPLRPSSSLSPMSDCAALWDAPHRLQQWFGARAFLLLSPDSYSGRVLEDEEAHTLLSAAALALSHAHITWPLLLPVHDAVRDAYQGVAVAAAAAGGATLHFDSDSLSTSRLAPGLLRLDHQLLLFTRQLGAAGAPAAAAACRAAAGAEAEAAPASLAADAAAAGGLGGCVTSRIARHVALAVRHSYAMPEPGEESDAVGASGWRKEEAGSAGGSEWDGRAPWRPWAAQADPIGCLELDVVWRFPTAAAALDLHLAAGEVAPDAAATMAGGSPDGLVPAEAAEWRLLALSPSYERDTGHRGFVLRPVDKPRRFLRLQSLAAPHAQRIMAGSIEVQPDLLPGDSSFYGMLLKLLESCRWAARAPDLGSLSSAEWWLRQGSSYQAPLAPDWVLQEATRDILQMTVLPVWPAFPPGSVDWPTSEAGQHGCLGKAAPLGALISRFALHALALGSPRSVAELWSRFVGTLRLQYWEALQPLPRMGLGKQRRQGQEEQQQQQLGDEAGEVDVSAAAVATASTGEGSSSSSNSRPEAPNLELSLLHQKLQMLDLCIHMMRQQQQQQQGQGQAQQWGEEEQQQQQQLSGQPGVAAMQPATTAGTVAAERWSWDSSDEMSEQQEEEQPKSRRLRQQRQQFLAQQPEGHLEQNGQQQQQQRLVPPSSNSSSSSSYFSAAGGSEAQLSPARSQQQLQQQQQSVEPAGAEADVEVDSAAAATAPKRSQRTQALANGALSDGAAVAAAGPEQAGAVEEEGGAGEPRGAVGVLQGASLYLHPDRPLRVPAVQEPPVQTEDLLAERHAAVQAAPASPVQDVTALRAQLQGRMLLSDMQAFKAANPGCCLLDFVRWHSPKDCVQAADGGWQLSGRMATQGNAWQQLWTAAMPVPAAQQRPLLDPQLEGERALHFLETLPPAALFSELLAVGYSAAVQVLSTAGLAAELPVVQQQLRCLSEEAGAELMHGVAAAAAAGPAEGGRQQGRADALVPAAADAASGQGQEKEEEDDEQEGWEATEEEEDEWEKTEDEDEEDEAAGAVLNGPAVPARRQQRQPSWLHALFSSGLSSTRYHRLLELLGCAEQTAVAAHSLLLRLGCQAQLQQRRQANSSGGGDGSVSSSSNHCAVMAVNDLLFTALGHAVAEQQQQQQQQQGEGPEPVAAAAMAPASVAVLPANYWPAAEALLLRRWADEEASSSRASSRAGSEDGSPGADWPAPFLREWLLQVHPGPGPAEALYSHTGFGAVQEEAATAAAVGAPAVGSLPVLQRMYIRALPSEVRIATVLCSEPCTLPH